MLLFLIHKISLRIPKTRVLLLQTMPNVKSIFFINFIGDFAIVAMKYLLSGVYREKKEIRYLFWL